jgi:hypothetical protein
VDPFNLRSGDIILPTPLLDQALDPKEFIDMMAQKSIKLDIIL